MGTALGARGQVGGAGAMEGQSPCQSCVLSQAPDSLGEWGGVEVVVGHQLASWEQDSTVPGF